MLLGALGITSLATLTALLSDGTSLLSRFGVAGFRESQPMTAEVRQRLVGELRESMRDGEVSEEEQVRMEALAHDLAVDGMMLADLVDQVEPRLREASRRLDAGADLMHSGSYESARSEFLAATLQDPGDPMAWLNLAEANRLTGRVRQAEEASGEALDRAPASWVVQYNTGLLLAQMDRPERALDHIERAVLLVDGPDRGALLRDMETNPVLQELRRRGWMEDLAARGGAR